MLLADSIQSPSDISRARGAEPGPFQESIDRPNDAEIVVDYKHKRRNIPSLHQVTPTLMALDLLYCQTHHLQVCQRNQKVRGLLIKYSPVVHRFFFDLLLILVQIWEPRIPGTTLNAIAFG